MTSSLGSQFEIVVADDGHIAEVVGDWPEAGREFELRNPPAHMSLRHLPERLAADPASAGRAICFYDEASARTCFCDDTGRVLRCVGIVTP